MAWSVPWQLMGLSVAGDCGGYSIYTDRYKRKIAYPKSPPKDPPSQKQIDQRAAFRNAQASWKVLSAQQKQNLEDACRKTSIPLTGQNLYMHTIMVRDKDAYHTIERQSGITLPTPY